MIRRGTGRDGKTRFGGCSGDYYILYIYSRKGREKEVEPASAGQQRRQIKKSGMPKKVLLPYASQLSSSAWDISGFLRRGSSDEEHFASRLSLTRL